MKLIYHNINKQNEVSPFDKALLVVSSNTNPLYLASPYIGLSFLKRIVESSIDWRLISDIDAWLSSTNRKDRAKCWEFIVQNIDKIKHYPDFHAKVAIGNNSLFLGSANFTNKGVLHRTELSVLIEDSQIVAESIVWFNNLWDIASQPIVNEGDELVKALNELLWTLPTARVKLSSSAPTVKSILSSSSRPTGFDIASTFALASIEESEKLLSLEQVYQTISDGLFSKAISFSYKELYDLMT